MPDPLSEVALYAHPHTLPEAKRIASRFNLPLASGQRKSTYRLYLGLERLELQCLDDDSPGPIYVDFVGGRARHRRLFGGGKNQPLARAIGTKGSKMPHVLDATAGFGRDAFVLASLGCRVTMLERNAVFAAMLADAIARAEINHETAAIVSRMQLLYCDAQEYIGSMQNKDPIDTIYLDPMYPQRNKTALVKKEMRAARELAGDDKDAGRLLELALSQPAARVVVKRPRSAATLNATKPTAVIESENTRYDIYIRQKRRET